MSDAELDYFLLYKKGGGFFERIIRNLYNHTVQPGDVVIDGGAHRGDHTFPLSKLVGQNGRVVAIEALPHVAEALRKDVEDRGIKNVDVVAKAIGVGFGEVTFNWVTNNEGYSGIQKRDYPPDVELRLITVPLTNIDALLENENRRLSTIKLDLEGGEYKAMNGAIESIKRHSPIIFFENGREYTCKYWDYSRDDFFAFFSAINYRIYELFMRELTPELWNANPWPYDFIAISDTDDRKALIFEKNKEFLMKHHNSIP